MDNRTIIKTCLEKLPPAPYSWMTLFGEGKPDIEGVIALFKDYCGYDAYFFNAQYRHNHNLVVKNLLDLWTNLESSTIFLQMLEQALRDANQKLNPQGSLVRRITYAQYHTGQIIDVEQLCFDLSEPEINRRKMETEQQQPPVKAQPQTIFPKSWQAFFVNDDIQAGIIGLLKDYCCYDSYFYNASRLFWGKSVHHHNDVIYNFLHEAEIAEEYIPYNLLLTELESVLRDADKPLNPEGSLVKRLKFIQSHLEHPIIDLQKLCDDLTDDTIELRKAAMSSDLIDLTLTNSDEDRDNSTSNNFR